MLVYLSILVGVLNSLASSNPSLNLLARQSMAYLNLMMTAVAILASRLIASLKRIYYSSRVRHPTEIILDLSAR